MKTIVAQKLKLGERSINNIMLNSELVERIIHEDPILIDEACKKYEISKYLINSLIKSGNISSFRNSLESKGSRLFIFEHELKKIISQGLNYRSHDLIQKTKDIVSIFINNSNLSDREVSIVRSVLICSQSYESVSEEYQLTKERVRQIYAKGISKLKRKKDMITEIDDIEKKLYSLKFRLANNKIDPSYNILSKHMSEFDLTVRCLNCLKAAEIESFGELISFKKYELMRFRNFGKKSLTELEELVHSKGYNFGYKLNN